MKEGIRINKYLSASGVMSRREADRFIIQKRITVDGREAEPGMKIFGTEEIRIDGKKLLKSPEKCRKVVLAYYKKRGTVTSTVDQGKENNNIIDAVNYPERVFPIGRLDKESEGLILLTNDGSLVNMLLRGAGGHEKEYEVTFDRPLSDSVIEGMERGRLELIPGRPTRPCKIKRVKKGNPGTVVRIILTEGINREIRRMAEYFGYRVVSLKRVRFINITLEGLKPGEYRELTEKEIRGLTGDAYEYN